MALSNELIQECVQRYLREQDRYVKMAEVVYEKCLEIVQKKLTVRATVQRRAKNAISFGEKLKKNDFRNRYSSVDEVFDNISDLAGVRIATYLESDREAVVDEIKKEFVNKIGEPPDVAIKDKDERGKHYRATHCQVYLQDGELAGANENLKGTTCEIQVCSLLAHVFNEIEHDLQYKPLSGDLSEAEKEFIDQLGLLTKAGDLTIKRMLSETDSRLKNRTGNFDDVHDFVARMRNEFPSAAVFPSNAGLLYDELRLLGLTSPEAIKQAVTQGSPDSIEQVSAAEYARVKAYAESKDDDILEDRSSDVLLAGILKHHVDRIIANHPLGWGRGRPSRLTQIARLYKEMLRERGNGQQAATAVSADAPPLAT